MSWDPGWIDWASVAIVGLWIVVVGVLLRKLPDWSVPTLFFARTVPEELPSSAVGRRILATYRRRIDGVTLLCLLAAIALTAGGFGLWAWSLLLVQTVAFLAAYLAARRAVLPLGWELRIPPEPPVETVNRPDLPGGWLGQAGPFVVLLGVGLWIASRMEQLPDRIPVHYGSDLAADAWSAPSLTMLLAPLVLGASTCATLWLVSLASQRWSRPPRSSHQADRLRGLLQMLLALNYLMAALFAAIGAWMAYPSERLHPGALALIVVGPNIAIVGLIIWMAVRYGAAREPAGAEPGDRTDDRHWKAGLIYYNPDDPAVMVENRFGIGYTLNMARPAARWVLALAVGLPLAMTVVLFLLAL